MLSTWQDNGVIQIFFSRHLKSSSVWECFFFFLQRCQLKMSTMFYVHFIQHPPKSEYFFKTASANFPLWTFSDTCKCNFSCNVIFFLRFLHFHPARSFFLLSKSQTVPPQNTFICGCDNAQVSCKSLANKISDKQHSEKKVTSPAVEHKCKICVISGGCGCCHWKPFGPTWLFPPAGSHIIIIYRKAAAELCDTTDRTQSCNDQRPPSTS